MISKENVGNEATRPEFESYRDVFPQEVIDWQPRKPVTFWFARHGESEYNTEDRIGGDSSITATGQLFADALPGLFGNVLKEAKCDPRFVTVFTSTLVRTIQTAAKLPLPQVHLWELDEIDAGSCDGMTYDDIKRYMPIIHTQRSQNKLTYRYPSGESYVDLCRRIQPVLARLQERNGNALVVAHQAVLRCFFGFFLGKRLAEITHLSVPHHRVFEVTVQPSGEISMRHHLMEAPTGPPAAWPFDVTSSHPPCRQKILPRFVRPDGALPPLPPTSSALPRTSGNSARSINRSASQLLSPTAGPCGLSSSAPAAAARASAGSSSLGPAPSAPRPVAADASARPPARRSLADDFTFGTPSPAAESAPGECGVWALAQTTPADTPSSGVSSGLAMELSRTEAGQPGPAADVGEGSTPFLGAAACGAVCPTCGRATSSDSLLPPSDASRPSASWSRLRVESFSDCDAFLDNIGNLGISGSEAPLAGDHGAARTSEAGDAHEAAAREAEGVFPSLAPTPSDDASPLLQEVLRRKLEDDEGYWKRRRAWREAVAHNARHKCATDAMVPDSELPDVFQMIMG